MHSHGNPNRDIGKAGARNAALRFMPGNRNRRSGLRLCSKLLKRQMILPPSALDVAD
jgi:hypothetical protein